MGWTGTYKSWVVDECDYEDAAEYTHASSPQEVAVRHAEKMYPDSDAASEFEIDVEDPVGNRTSHTVFVSFEPHFTAAPRKPKTGP